MGKHKYSAILKIVILFASVALASSTRNDSLTAFRKIHCDSGSANIDTLLSDTIYNVGGIKTASGFWGTVGQPGGAQFTLPASDGTSGQVLTTNGSRGLYFTNGGGGGTGTITSINGSSTAIQTIIPGTGLFVKDSGTGNSVHNIAAASGYLIPTGSNKRVDSTTLADSSKVSAYSTRSDSSRADHFSDSANGSKYLGGHASSFFQTYYSILTAIGSLSTGTNGALYNTSGTVSWQDSVFHAYWARLSDSAKAYDNRYLGRHQVADSSHFADSAWRADSTRLADSAAVSHYATRADSSRAAHVSDTALDAGKFAGKSWPLDSCNDAKLFAGHAWPVDSVRADHKADTAINSSHARSSDTVVSLIEWNKIHNAPSFMLTFPNPDSGNGTANYVARFLSQNKVGTGVIYDNGTNVGIGTTSPTVKLVVQSAAANSNAMYINASGGTNNLFSFVDNNSTGDALFVMNKNTESGSISTGIVLNTNGWSFLNGGNVGIGTTSPGSLLQVNGGAAIGYSSSTAAPTNGLTIAGLACIGTTSPTAYTALSILENNTSINGAFSVTNNSSSNTLTASSLAIIFSSGTAGSVYNGELTSSSLGQSYGSSVINQINSNDNSFLAIGYKLGVNIGIPAYTLDVSGDINSNGSIRINDGHIALQIGRLASSDICEFTNTAGDFELIPFTQVRIGGGGNLLVDGDATISGDAILQGDIYTTQMTNTGLSIVGWSTQTGKGVYYVKVGKRVDVFFDLIGMGSGTNAYVTGLPVASTVISNQNFIEAYDNSTQSVGLCGTSGGQLNFSPNQAITSNLWTNGTSRNAIGMLTYYTN